MTYGNFRMTKSDVAQMFNLSEDELDELLANEVNGLFGVNGWKKTVYMDDVIYSFSKIFGHKKCFKLANKFYGGFERVEE